MSRPRSERVWCNNFVFPLSVFEFLICIWSWRGWERGACGILFTNKSKYVGNYGITQTQNGTLEDTTWCLVFVLPAVSIGKPPISELWCVMVCLVVVVSNCGTDVECQDTAGSSKGPSTEHGPRAFLGSTKPTLPAAGRRDWRSSRRHGPVHHRGIRFIMQFSTKHAIQQAQSHLQFLSCLKSQRALLPRR